MFDIIQLKFLYDTPKTKLLEYAAVCILPYITWKFLYTTYKEENQKYKDFIKFQKRHNCVVMFDRGKGHTGWPMEKSTDKLDIKHIDLLFEPLLYYINTAKKSLDVAIMLINVKCILEALINAHNRGVKVRIISNFYMDVSTTNAYRELKREGIQVTFFVSKDKTNTIMHTKYIVKDFDESNGYLMVGSFNVTYNSFTNNYEDLVFTSNRDMVEDFHNNFNIMLRNLEEDNENMFNRLILENAGFLP